MLGSFHQWCYVNYNACCFSPLKYSSEVDDAQSLQFLVVTFFWKETLNGIFFNASELGYCLFIRHSGSKVHSGSEMGQFGCLLLRFLC